MVTLEFPCQVETSTGKHQGVHMDTSQHKEHSGGSKC